jgi:hypothetical protein
MADSRREAPINVHQERRGLYRLTIENELWASVEWCRRRNSWCIEDSCNRCLMHVAGIHGEAPKASKAIAVAKQMIRSGEMPSLETVKARMRGNMGY